MTWTDDDMTAVMTALYRQSHGVHDQAVSRVLVIIAAAIDAQLRRKGARPSVARAEEPGDA